MPAAEKTAVRTPSGFHTLPVGSTCVWRPAPGASPAAAIVTLENHHGILNLFVFPDGMGRGQLKESVRHSTDPRNPKMIDAEQGVWDFVNVD